MKQTFGTATRPTIVYDGECRFCRSKIENWRSQDTQQRMDYVPRQDQMVEQRFPQIVGTDLEQGLLFIEPSGKVHVAADAVYQIASYLPGWQWRLFVIFYRIPLIKQILQLGYRLVAMNRQRLGQVCDKDACGLD